MLCYLGFDATRVIVSPRGETSGVFYSTSRIRPCVCDPVLDHARDSSSGPSSPLSSGLRLVFGICSDLNQKFDNLARLVAPADRQYVRRYVRRFQRMTSSGHGAFQKLHSNKPSGLAVPLPRVESVRGTAVVYMRARRLVAQEYAYLWLRQHDARLVSRNYGVKTAPCAPLL